MQDVFTTAHRHRNDQTANERHEVLLCSLHSFLPLSLSECPCGELVSQAAGRPDKCVQLNVGSSELLKTNRAVPACCITPPLITLTQ